VVGVALLAFSSAASMPVQIVYHGRTYASMVEVSAIEVKAHIGVLRPTASVIDGKAVYVSPGTPPQVVALALSGGRFDAYQLGG
jgi:hypothetical protein